MQEVTPAGFLAETLGMRIIFSQGVCGHTDKRIFRIWSALRVLMHRQRVSGRVMQQVAGHVSFGAITSRGVLSLLDSVYKFAAKHWMSCVIPCVSLKCELRAYAGLLPLLKGDSLVLAKSTPRMHPKKNEWSSAIRTVPVSLSSRVTVVFWSAVQSACERHQNVRKLFLLDNLALVLLLSKGQNAVFSCACGHPSDVSVRIPCKLILDFSMRAVEGELQRPWITILRCRLQPI